MLPSLPHPATGLEPKKLATDTTKWSDSVRTLRCPMSQQRTCSINASSFLVLFRSCSFAYNGEHGCFYVLLVFLIFVFFHLRVLTYVNGFRSQCFFKESFGWYEYERSVVNDSRVVSDQSFRVLFGQIKSDIRVASAISVELYLRV